MCSTVEDIDYSIEESKMHNERAVREKGASLGEVAGVLEAVDHSRRLADKLGACDPNFDQKKFSDVLSGEDVAAQEEK